MMKHRSTMAIFGEWQRLALGRDGFYRAPPRGAIQPRKLGRHLSDLFLAQTDAAGQIVFRLGGTRICTLFGRELKGQRLLSLWAERDRPALDEMARSVCALAVPALSRHDGISLSGRSLRFEMLLAPLQAGDGGIGLMGSIAVLDEAAWVGADPLIFGHRGEIEPVAPDLAVVTEMPCAAVSGSAAQTQPGQQATFRQRHNRPALTVIHGGKI